jgi:Disulfide bond formation protein DsbB
MITQYFALLALGSFGTFFVIAMSSIPRDGRVWWRYNLGPGALAAASVVAIVTTGGSLYLSEVLHYLPCRLCWVQRGFTYPLALLLPAALIFRKRSLHRLALPMSILGACVSAYHVALERFPSLESSATCDPQNPCSLIWVQHFRFVTIPVMALAAFLLQISLALIGWQQSSHPTTHPTSPLKGHHGNENGSERDASSRQ